VGLPFFTASALFGSNLTGFFGVPMQYGPLWSLAVEEQFYLVWPLVLRRWAPRAALGIAVTIVLGTPLLRLYAFRAGVGDLYMHTWFVFDGLAFGAVLAFLVRSQLRAPQACLRVGAASIVFGLAVLGVGTPFGIFHRTNAVGAALQLWPWYFVFGGIILVALGAATLGLVTPHRRVLGFFGRISYGLYLVHLVMFMLYDNLITRVAPAMAEARPHSLFLIVLRLMVAGGASVAIAKLSRETFEEFFLRKKGH
jgi:peptidoglycan/LPS O-acetylase OafA/YrhL